MGKFEREYIRNLAFTLIGALKVDQEIFQTWENFPPVISPGRAMNMHCGDKVGRWLNKCRPETLGKIGSFGRQNSPHFPSAGTTIHEVLGDEGLDARDWGGWLIHKIARATILAEMTDILLERLTPEQKYLFFSSEDPNSVDEGIDPTRGRSYRCSEGGELELVD